mgnify:FL=1
MGLSTIKCRKTQQNSYIIVEFYQNAEKRKKTPYEWVCTANKDEKRIRVLWGESADKVEPKNALKEIRVIPAHYPLRGRQSVTPILVTGFKQAA